MKSDPLTTYLESVIRRRYRMGIWDCAAFCGGWVAINRGVNPTVLWREHYREWGELVAVFDDVAAALGIERTDAPRRGDVVLIETAAGPGGAIVTGSNIVAVGAHGGLVSRHRSLAQIIAGWRI